MNEIFGLAKEEFGIIEYKAKRVEFCQKLFAISLLC